MLLSQAPLTPPRQKPGACRGPRVRRASRARCSTLLKTSGRKFLSLTVERLPDTFKIHEVTQNVQLRDISSQEIQRAMQVLAMVFGLACRVVVECGQAAVRAAI